MVACNVDCGVAVYVLYKKFMAMKKQSKEKGLTWDMKICVVGVVEKMKRMVLRNE